MAAAMIADNRPFYRRRGFLAGLVAMLVIIVATASLGFWQLDRAAQKSALQADRDRARARAPLDLSRVGALPTATATATAAAERLRALDGAKVLLEGTFVPQKAVFLDNRTRDGIAGFEVLMPIEAARDGRLVMVMRGWIAGDPRDRNRMPDVKTPGGTQRVEGLAMMELPQPMVLGSTPEPGPQDRIWQHFSFDHYTAWSGRTIVPLIVRQIAEPAAPDGLDRRWNQPGTGVDKHRAYAFQWFAMSAAGLAFVIGLVLRAVRSGRHAG